MSAKRKPSNGEMARWLSLGTEPIGTTPEQIVAKHRSRGNCGCEYCKEARACPNCIEAMRHANSDATTPGFFYDKCEKHREAKQ